MLLEIRVFKQVKEPQVKVGLSDRHKPTDLPYLDYKIGGSRDQIEAALEVRRLGDKISIPLSEVPRYMNLIDICVGRLRDVFERGGVLTEEGDYIDPSTAAENHLWKIRIREIVGCVGFDEPGGRHDSALIIGAGVLSNLFAVTRESGLSFELVVAPKHSSIDEGVVLGKATIVLNNKIYKKIGKYLEKIAADEGVAELLNVIPSLTLAKIAVSLLVPEDRILRRV